MSLEGQVKESNFATVTKNLRRTMPVRCEECPIINTVAKELPQRAEILGIELQYLIEPFAEVSGDCIDGKIELDYGECSCKCSNPNLDIGSNLSIKEQLVVKIIDRADHSQNFGKGEM